jgi:hypothetical protein
MVNTANTAMRAATAAESMPLFRKFPALQAKLPHVSLGLFPTPVEKADRLGAAIGLDRVYMKRDDLSGTVYGGNKIRMLEFLLGGALRANAKEVVTLGYAGSNHALALAIYADKLGLKCSSYLLPQANAHYVRRNLLACYRHHARLHAWQTADAPAGVNSRLTRVWRAEVSGSASGNIKIDTTGLSDFGDGSTLRLLADADGTFANATVVTGTYSAPYFTVAGQTLASGTYYTLGGNFDADGDGLPNEWEATYYGGTTNANPDALAANGVNTVREAYIADLNPTNPASFFVITAISNSPATTVSFVSSANRAYTLIGVSNLVSGVWTNVPGAGPRPGAGGADALSDTNLPPRGPFYKLQVELP